MALENLQRAAMSVLLKKWATTGIENSYSARFERANSPLGTGEPIPCPYCFLYGNGKLARLTPLPTVNNWGAVRCAECGEKLEFRDEG